MPKRSFDVAFKKEVIAYCEADHTAYEAVKHFSDRDGCKYDIGNFYQWLRKKEVLKEAVNERKRVLGGGRKRILGDLEDILKNEIIELRLQKMKVTREWVGTRAHQIAEEHGLPLKAKHHWVSEFMARNELSLRRMTNLTTLTDEQLVQRALEYFKFLRSKIASINLTNTILMDETAIYFEDARMQTVDVRGRHHVVIKSTGFASMRITAVFGVWADGRKAPPLLIHKGKQTNAISWHGGPILSTTQEKAWVNSELMVRWIDAMFPAVNVAPGKCIIWDSCRAHIAGRVKTYCHQRNIQMIVIPGGMTPYLQAGDIGIFRELKDYLSRIIDEWKRSPAVEYTRGNNPKPPRDQVVRSWVLDSWRRVSFDNIRRSIASAGFADNYRDWHVSKHDVYGELFNEAWENSGEVEVDGQELENIPQEDELFEDLEVHQIDDSDSDC
jgi:hypothetical protein